jgi:hypothetical protein
MKVALIADGTAESFKNALKADVLQINVEFSDTFSSLKDKINVARGENVITNVVFASHAEPILRIGSERILPVDASTWEGLRQFLLDMKLMGVASFDFLACLFYLQPGVPEMFLQLEKETGVDLRASTDDTGNVAQGGNWVLESDMADIQELYFTEEIEDFRGLFYAYTNSSMYDANKIIKDICGNFIYLHKDISGRPINPPSDLAGYNLKYPGGSVVSWGENNGGGNILDSDYGVKGGDLSSNVIAIYSTATAFAGLKSDGSVVSWGQTILGGNILDSDYGVKGGDVSSNVIAIYSTAYAFE